MRESNPPNCGDVENGVKRQIGIIKTDQSGGSSFIVDTDFLEDLVGKILSQIPFLQVYRVRTLSKYWCSKFRRRGYSQESLYPLGTPFTFLFIRRRKIFLVIWSLQNGSFEKKHLPVEYDDDLQVYEAGISLVGSKLLVVVLFENVKLETLPDIFYETHDSGTCRRGELSVTEFRVYEYKSEGCQFAEFYRSARHRYGRNLVADSTCIYFVKRSSNMYGERNAQEADDLKISNDLTITRFNVLAKTFHEGTRSMETDEDEVWKTCSSCFQPGLENYENCCVLLSCRVIVVISYVITMLWYFVGVLLKTKPTKGMTIVLKHSTASNRVDGERA
ncbi:hypothetical protein R1flu_022048 [Riccia fluitans]|uniref:F-box domain-containing protein n=1 Tax=Riccia fluitans TaxID=41844 RepID=A0ABD1ZRF8_9MARC